VRSPITGQFVDLTIIYAYEIYAFADCLGDFSLLQFGEINFSPLDTPTCFSNLMFTGANQTTRWFDGRKTNLLMALQPGQYTCPAVTGQGRPAFLRVDVNVNQVLTRDFNVSHNGSGFYPYTGFRFDSTPAVTSRACNSAISTFPAAAVPQFTPLIPYIILPPSK
jgi:hypothetical protein